MDTLLRKRRLRHAPASAQLTDPNNALAAAANAFAMISGGTPVHGTATVAGAAGAATAVIGTGTGAATGTGAGTAAATGAAPPLRSRHAADPATGADAAASAATTAAPVPLAQLMAGQRELGILHGDEIYLLRVTRANKLILTKARSAARHRMAAPTADVSDQPV